MNLRSLLKEAIAILEKSKIADAEHDAQEILLNLLDMDMARFLFECEDELEDRFDKLSIQNLITEYNELIGARASHFPLQYITGESYFCGLRFMTDQNVLIPRQDTEILVEKVLADNPDRNKFILDLCTGSGCIATALATLGDYKLIVGTDISDDALELASKNAEELVPKHSFDDEMNQQLYFLRSDLFSNIDKIKEKLGIEKFDIITCNPPYIKSSDINNLQEEVRKYEPHLALDGDKDGLKFYRLIAKEAKKYLNDGGKIYLEIGFDQASYVKKIFETSGYTFAGLEKDLSKIDRVIIFCYNNFNNE